MVGSVELGHWPLREALIERRFLPGGPALLFAVYGPGRGQAAPALDRSQRYGVFIQLSAPAG